MGIHIACFSPFRLGINLLGCRSKPKEDALDKAIVVVIVIKECYCNGSIASDTTFEDRPRSKDVEVVDIVRVCTCEGCLLARDGFQLLFQEAGARNLKTRSCRASAA